MCVFTLTETARPGTELDQEKIGTASMSHQLQSHANKNISWGSISTLEPQYTESRHRHPEQNPASLGLLHRTTLNHAACITYAIYQHRDRYSHTHVGARRDAQNCP